jgi:hypothetical protein
VPAEETTYAFNRGRKLQSWLRWGLALRNARIIAISTTSLNSTSLIFYTKPRIMLFLKALPNRTRNSRSMLDGSVEQGALGIQLTEITRTLEKIGK